MNLNSVAVKKVHPKKILHVCRPSLMLTFFTITTNPRRFGNVCGGIRSWWKKFNIFPCRCVLARKNIRFFFVPGHTCKELLQIFPCRASLVSPICTNSHQNVQNYYNSSPGCPGKKKSDFLTRGILPSHQSDLSRQMVSGQSQCRGLITTSYF